MTRVLTIADLLWLLLWLCGQGLSAMGRSRHNVLTALLALSLLVLALSVLLSYRCFRISRLRNPYLLDDLSDQSMHLYEQLADSRHRSMLLRNHPPLTVHYMWCRNGVLEFKHYLSLMSTVKVLKPDQIVFHYLQLPQVDRKGYFAWFENVQREVAMITLRPIHNAKHCGHQFSKGLNSKSEDFPNTDGVFMTEDVAIAKLSREDFYRYTGADKLLTSMCAEDEVCVGVQRTPAQLFLVPGSEPYHLTGGRGRAVIECPTIEEFNKASNSTCLQLSQRLFPSDIWRRSKPFDGFARWVAYNHPDPMQPQPHPDRATIPNVAHVLKLDGDDLLSPMCYASLLSAFTQGAITHVFVHGQLDTSADNLLWKQLTDRYALTHIPVPGLDHNTHSWRRLLYGLQVLLQYGGVVLSCDTLIQKPLTPLLRYGAVSSVQKTPYRIVHHHMDLDVLLAAPASPYLQSLAPVLQQMVEVASLRDVGAVAYHLYEHRPASLYLDSQLLAHLTCRGDRCVPSAGQLDVRQAYSVKLTWVEGAPPSTWQQWTHLSTPLRSLPSVENPPSN